MIHPMKKKIVLIAKTLFPQRLFPIPRNLVLFQAANAGRSSGGVGDELAGGAQYLFLTFNGISGIYIN